MLLSKSGFSYSYDYFYTAKYVFWRMSGNFSSICNKNMLQRYQKARERSFLVLLFQIIFLEISFSMSCYISLSFSELKL